MRFFALGYVMENHTINKGEREQKFLEIKENKSCIINPMGVCGFHGGCYCFGGSSGGMYSIRSCKSQSKA